MDIQSGTTREEQVTTTPEAIRSRARKRNMLVFAVSGVLCVVLLALIWSQLTTPAAPTQQASASDGGSSSNAVSISDTSSPLVGKPAPDFTLPVPNGGGKTIHLSDLRGKPVVLNFWASWCGPCNQEAPVLSQAWPQLQSKGIQLLGVEGPEDLSFSRNFLQKYNITYQNVQDTPNNSTSVAYGVTAFPETVFIDKNGIVVAKYAAPFTDVQTLDKELAHFK